MHMEWKHEVDDSAWVMDNYVHDEKNYLTWPGSHVK